MATFTLTFGDQAENHVGMQKLGQLASEGFALSDLLQARAWFEQRGVQSIIYDLRTLLPAELVAQAEEAYLLVVPRGVDAIVESSALLQEQLPLPKDTKALMYGRVVNKHARHNLCFDEMAQEPNYEQGRGRVVAFDQVPQLARLRATLPEILGERGRNLVAEGNYYFDVAKCYIGYHGDSERRRVVAVRLGASFPFHYQWYWQSKPVGRRGSILLNHGDFYVMSEKAVGTDWKKKSILTLRHAAGLDRHL